jgi:deoxyadenosine/deoxycytidine kinase
MARSEPIGGVIERPPQEMLGVFARNLHEEHMLDDDELRLLERIGELGEVVSAVPDLLIVLRGSPERLLTRIETRQASDRDAYDLRDMQRLAAVYDRWISRWDRTPVIEVDVDIRDVRRSAEVERVADEVREALRIPRSSGV